MSARKVAIRALICILSIFAVSTHGQQSTANPKKAAQSRKTVGDLLKKIEDSNKTQFNKKSSALPSFNKVETAPVKHVDLYQVKPPSRSHLYYEEGTNEAKLEEVTEEGIKQLYKLTNQFKTSKRRGELWLRLAELYVEKSRLIEYRLQQKYDDKLKEMQRGQTKIHPKLDLTEAQEYNRRAIQLYEWFLRDFPTDPKIDQALFFLGYNYFELNQPERGKDYYKKLTKEHPGSPYIEESNFALGEYHFDREQWADALVHYRAVAANKRARLYSFALYKSAWCEYKTGAQKQAMLSLEKVIRNGRVAKGQQDKSASGAGSIRLATEAQRDMVVFYAEAGTPQGARSYFEEVVGPKATFNLLEKLAYYYADQGNREGARMIFRDLIQERPNAPKAYDYQYQIVTMYTSTDKPEVFRAELYSWIQNYSPSSAWAEANKKDKELTARAYQLIETTLRNHILQQHQTAQNSRVPNAQKNARQGYELYFQTFKEGAKLDEMHFFYAELLFDLKEFEAAEIHYAWVTENSPNSPYFEKASLNMVLAAEKGLPKEEDLKKMVGESVDPRPFDKNVKAFEVAALRYMKAFPKGETVPAIKFKLGSLYYYHNQFDKALEAFNSIIKQYPKSQYAQYSANLTLDIYNLKKDYAGLEKAGQDILSNEDLAKSSVGASVKDVLQRASFKKAQDLEAAKDFPAAALAYEEFARKNPGGDLALSASFNAAVDFERAGDLLKAISMYSVVLADRNPKNENLHKQAAQFVAALYEKTGQYLRAAEAFEGYAAKHPKEKESVAFHFNAAVIRDGMNAFGPAIFNYQKYLEEKKGHEKFEALFLLAKLYERRGNNMSKAQDYYKQYIETGGQNKASLIEAAFAIAQMNAKKGKRAEAEAGYKKVINMQKTFSTPENPVGVSQAAECKFILVSKTFEEMRSFHISSNPAKMKKSLEEKVGFLNHLKKQLEDVIKYDDGPMIVNSLALVGQAYQHMAASIYAVPVPKGLDAEQLKTYRAGIDQFAQPFQEEAIKNYESAIKRGFELMGYSEGLKTAQRELNRLKKEKAEDYGERAIITKITDYMGVADQSDLGPPFKEKDEHRLVEAAAKRLGKDPSDLLALNALAVFYFEQGKFGLARILLSRMEKAHINEPGVYNNQGVIFLSEGKQRQALALLQKALDLKNSYTVAAANLGSIFVEYKDYGRAVDKLAEGYATVKSDLRRGVGMDVANNYALALSGTNDTEKARSIFQEILKADNGNVTALLNYSILLVHRLKDKKEGEKQLNRLRFVTDDGDVRMKKAIDDMDKALSQN